MLKKLYHNDFVLKIYARITNFLFGNSLKIIFGGGHSTTLLRKFKMKNKGKNNFTQIGDRCRIINCNAQFYGNNNKIIIDDGCYLKNVAFWFEDDNNTIHIKKHTKICGKTDLACIEGSVIEIGEDCLFSSNIAFRTGDSHSVLDLNGVRINPSKKIVIGNHVWIGQNCFIGKGSEVPDNSIVGACAVVTKKFNKTNVAIAGNPAKIIKENIDWCSKRI